MNNYRNFAGFTLIELLVSIVIIGILSVTSIAIYNNYMSNSREAVRKAEQDTACKKFALKCIENEDRNDYCRFNRKCITDGFVLRRVGGGGWTAGAESTDKFSGDGYVSIEVREGINGSRLFGLSTENTNDHPHTIEFSIYARSDMRIEILENGTRKQKDGSSFFGTYAVGDTLRVSREGTTIKYFKNKELLSSTAGAPVTDLLADCSMYSTDTVIVNAKINGDLIIWTNIHGAVFE